MDGPGPACRWKVVCSDFQTAPGAFRSVPSSHEAELVQSSIDVRWIAVVLDREIVLIDRDELGVDGDADTSASAVDSISEVGPKVAASTATTCERAWAFWRRPRGERKWTERLLRHP